MSNRPDSAAYWFFFWLASALGGFACVILLIGVTWHTFEQSDLLPIGLFTGSLISYLISRWLRISSR